LVQDSRHSSWRKQERRNVNKVLELASVCEHPNAVWLTKLFAGRFVVTDEEAREVFLGCENDSRALCCAFRLGGFFDEIRRKAADVGDAFAQAVMAEQTNGDESFQTAKGERDGFYWLGRCYEHGIGCEQDVERAKETFLVAVELGDVYATGSWGEWFDKDDPQRFVLVWKSCCK
jgi:hypothetical protein